MWVARQLDEATLGGGWTGYLCVRYCRFYPGTTKQRARPRDAVVGIRLLELGSSRNVPGSDVRSQSGVEPPAFGRAHIPANPVSTYLVGLERPDSSFPSSCFPRFVGPKRVTQAGDSGKTQEQLGGATVDHARPRRAVSKRKLTSKLASRASTNLAAGRSCRCTRRGRQARGV